MKTCVFSYWDKNRSDCATHMLPTAKRFCDENGLELLVTGKVLIPNPMVVKPRYISNMLRSCDRLIYCDADVLFREGAKADPLFQKPINFSTDTNGICAGFIALEKSPEVEKFLRVWAELGGAKVSPTSDQDTAKMMIANWQWADDLACGLPDVLVSSPESERPGAIAHHFWGHAGDAIPRQMAVFDWTKTVKEQLKWDFNEPIQENSSQTS